jgi:hypothetical protein
MEQKSTDELLRQLNSCNNIDDYFKKNEDSLIHTSIADYLYNVFKEKCLVKSQVFKKAEVDEIYGYQIFSGRKNPSRNTLIAICIGARFTLNEIQTALKIAGYATLYAKNKRDSLIIYGISHAKSVLEINELLFNEEEDTLN